MYHSNKKKKITWTCFQLTEKNHLTKLDMLFMVGEKPQRNKNRNFFKTIKGIYEESHIIVNKD